MNRRFKSSRCSSLQIQTEFDYFFYPFTQVFHSKTVNIGNNGQGKNYIFHVKLRFSFSWCKSTIELYNDDRSQKD